MCSWSAEKLTHLDDALRVCVGICKVRIAAAVVQYASKQLHHRNAHRHEEEGSQDDDTHQGWQRGYNTPHQVLQEKQIQTEPKTFIDEWALALPRSAE